VGFGGSAIIASYTATAHRFVGFLRAVLILAFSCVVALLDSGARGFIV